MSYFGILVLMMLLGGAGCVLALIVLTIKHNRFGLLAVIGGLAFVAFIVISWGICYLAMERHDVSVKSATVWAGGPMNDAARNAAQGLQEFKVSVGTSPPSRVWPTSPLWVVILACVLAAVVFRRLSSPGPAYRHRRIWPALLVIPLLAIFFFGSVRYKYSVNQAQMNAARQQAEVMASQEQAKFAIRRAELEAKSQQLIAQADIHEQMDKFDGPRIPLPPGKASPNVPAAPPTASATPVKQVLVAKRSVEKTSGTAATDATGKTAASGDNSPSKSTNGETLKPPAASNHKHKKLDKAPGSGEPHTIETFAQSQPAEEPSGTKEKDADHETISTVADGKPDKPSASRPAWVDESPRRTGNYRHEVIATDEYATVDECYQAADIYLLLKTYQYMLELAGRPYIESVRPNIVFHSNMVLADGNVISYGRGTSFWVDRRLQALSNMGIGIDYVRRELVAKDPNNNEPREYVETTSHSSVGPMKKLYLQIEFTPAVETALRQYWNAHERQERFAMVGVGAGSILALLSLIFALLKIDTLTKGYYTKRLFIGVPAAIIGGLLLLMSKTIVDIIK